MKKNILLIIAIVSLFGVNVKAAETDLYVNPNGVKMTYEDYNKLNAIYDDGFAEMLDQELFDKVSYKLKTELVSYEDVYIKTSTKFNKNREVIAQFDEQITAEEYSTQLFRGNYCGMAEECWETNAKKIHLTIQKESNNIYYLNSTTTWKTMPSVRSNDLVAIRFGTPLTNPNTYHNVFSYIMYTKTGSTAVTATYNNSVKSWLDNGNTGWVYSVKLPTYSLSALKIVEQVKVSPSGYEPQIVRSTYQHAVQNISSTTALGCVSGFAGGYGLGGLLVMQNNTCTNYFDQMGGVNTTFVKTS